MLQATPPVDCLDSSRFTLCELGASLGWLSWHPSWWPWRRPRPSSRVAWLPAMYVGASSRSRWMTALLQSVGRPVLVLMLAWLEEESEGRAKVDMIPLVVTWTKSFCWAGVGFFGGFWYSSCFCTTSGEVILVALCMNQWIVHCLPAGGLM